LTKINGILQKPSLALVPAARPALTRRPAGVTMWLSGYYNASVRNTVIDLCHFARTAKPLKDFGRISPRATVMSAAERARGIKMPLPDWRRTARAAA
jgi:hypothetical protein